MTADQNKVEGYQVTLCAGRAYVVLLKELTLGAVCERNVYRL